MTERTMSDATADSVGRLPDALLAALLALANVLAWGTLVLLAAP